MRVRVEAREIQKTRSKNRPREEQRKQVSNRPSLDKEVLQLVAVGHAGDFAGVR